MNDITIIMGNSRNEIPKSYLKFAMTLMIVFNNLLREVNKEFVIATQVDPKVSDRA